MRIMEAWEKGIFSVSIRVLLKRIGDPWYEESRTNETASFKGRAILMGRRTERSQRIKNHSKGLGLVSSKNQRGDVVLRKDATLRIFQ